MAKHIPTMTAHELADKLQGLGLRMTEVTFNALLDAGQFPFVLVGTTKGGKKVYRILTKLFEKWLDDVSADDGTWG